MGIIFSRVFSALFGKGEVRILILGLDNAGKTTILHKLQLSPITETIPTMSFNVESVTYQNIKLQVWDLGGQGTIRPYWRCYYPNTNAVVYVVDCADRERIDISKQEMMSMLQEEDLAGVPLLVFANKQDIAGAMSDAELSDRMGLINIRNRQWRLCPSVAKKGIGISEGFDWYLLYRLVNIIKS